jgi:hypothetical protein
VDQTWQGTKVAPRIPTKKRMINRPLASVTVPASAVGMEPARRTPGGVVNIGSSRNKRLYIPAKTYRGPYLSQSGPTINLTMRLNRAVRAITLQLLLDLDLRCNQGQDVGVSDFCLGKMKIFLDGFRELIYVSTTYHKSNITMFPTYQWRKGIPREECNHKSEGGEEECSSIFVERVKDRYRKCLLVYWVDFGSFPKNTDAHCGDVDVKNIG